MTTPAQPYPKTIDEVDRICSAVVTALQERETLLDLQTWLQHENTRLLTENRFLRGIQKRVGRWVTETLGAENDDAGLSPLENRNERCLRFVEEALELAQAVGVTREMLHRLVDYVMDRPVGHLPQEIGGTMLTLYAVSEACGIDANDEAMREVERVETPEIREKVRRRQVEKRAALVADPGVASV